MVTILQTVFLGSGFDILNVIYKFLQSHKLHHTEYVGRICLGAVELLLSKGEFGTV